MNTPWTFEEASRLFHQPFHDLLFTAHTVFRQHFDPHSIQVSTLLNIKTGGCPEDCAYCPQSAHYKTGLEKEPLFSVEDIITSARKAKASGATRFCMGAAWKNLHNRDLPLVCSMIQHVKELGLETCVTLGGVTKDQAKSMKESGLDFYNHNIDTSPDYYSHIITTRTFEERLATLENVRNAGVKVCCGGILGMGESNDDRIKMLITLATLPTPPESIPINQLIPIPGTPLEGAVAPDPLDFVRTIALTRLMMPHSYVRLSAGREGMSDELQALCFFAGANSIFYGEKLLTALNPEPLQDDALFKKLGLKKEAIL